MTTTFGGAGFQNSTINALINARAAATTASAT
jgi:hypothetical protein